MSGGFKEKFFTIKRRTTQGVLERLGKAHATPDTEYEERKERALGLWELLRSTSKHCQDYLNHVRGLCFASAELGSDFQRFFEGGDARLVRVAEQFQGSMSKIDEETRKAMDDRVVEQVMEPLKAKLADFDDLKTLMKTREQYKVDYDAYLRNVRSLKEKASSNAKKLGEKERKLAAAKKLLEDSTAEVYYRFDTLEDQRTVMVLEEFRTITNSLTGFYQTTAGMLSGLGDIPNVDAPAARPRPVISIAADDAASGAGAGAGASTPPAASAPAPGGSKTTRAKALYDYAPQNGDELELHVDDVIEVLNKQEDGWWEGQVGGRRGVFPANYVEEL